MEYVAKCKAQRERERLHSHAILQADLHNFLRQLTARRKWHQVSTYVHFLDCSADLPIIYITTVYTVQHLPDVY